jgi:hypothetical protein
MSCEQVETELVGYHFGVIDDGPRCEVEEHLLDCPICLRAFLALKRDIETAESCPRPSPVVRDRLRASAMRELGLESRPWSWWERPLALGFAGTVTLIAIMSVTAFARGPGTPPCGLTNLPVISSPVTPPDNR